MNTHQTICQGCGKLVPLAPTVCVLCGDNLVPHVIYVQPATVQLRKAA